MWVVKLGGSLLGSQELTHWLDLFARHGNGEIVIVPGGGIFADAVRESQKRCGSDEKTAHRMAVMAMDQYGVLMAGMNPALALAQSELEIAERGWQHRTSVWLPSAMISADEKIPANWQVTSDSLAAWLATRLNAEHLILIKSERPDTDQISLEQLSKDGIVDQHFGDFTAGRNFRTWLLGKNDYPAFADGISQKKLNANAVPVRCAWN
jgi:5-(aminomethyl)-3-furanmethanol phosphate kinase